MVGRQFEKTVDRLYSECGIPMKLPAVVHNSLVGESKRNGSLRCFGFGNLHDSDREAATFGEVAIVFLVFSWTKT